MTHDALDPIIRDAVREAWDDEYESSTPAAGRWRERAEIRRPGSNPPAPRSVKPPPPPNPPPERSVKGDAPKYDAPMAQRHRFGRVLDKPKVRSDLDDSRWLVWFALYLAAVVVALVVIWLVAA